MARRFLPRADAVAALSLIAVLTLSSCSAGGSSETIAPAEGPQSAQDSFVRTEGGSAADQGMGAPADGESVDASGKLIAEEESAEILTASMNLRVKDPGDTAEDVRQIASSVGGKVSYAVERPGNEYEYGSAQLTLRVPPESLDGVMAAIGDYGVLLSSESGSQDVSREQTDYEVRIASLKTSIARLNGLLAQSQTTTDLIEIERELQARESELESMTAMLTGLNDRVDLATLSVTLTAEDRDSQPEKVDPENFFTGFERGLEGLAAFGAGLLVFLGLSLPWLLVIAVLGSIAMIFVTPSRRKRRRKAAPVAARSETAAPQSDRAPEMVEDQETPKGTDG